MIRDLAQLDPSDALGLIYGALSASVVAGSLVGLAVLLITGALRLRD